MPDSRRILALLCAAALGVLSVPCRGGADEPPDRSFSQAAELLPESTIGFVELADPGRLVTTVLEHPLRPRIEQLDAWKKGLQNQRYLEFQFGLKIVELALGVSWREAVSILGGDGICASFDAQTQGVAILARSRDASRLVVLRDKLIILGREDAKRKGQPDPYEVHDYRGVTAYVAGGNASALLGPWLLISNKGDLTKSIIDRYFDGTGRDSGSLARSSRYRAAREGATRNATAWFYGDLEAVRTAGVAREVFAGKTDNPVAELLVGGLLDIARNTPFATATFDLDDQGARLEFAVPFEAGWVSDARQHFFGPGAAGTASPVPEVPETLFSLTTYRDLSRMWRRADELLKDEPAAQLAQANTQLSTLFSGKDFGEEILGALSPKWQFVATRAEGEEGYPRPAIRLPAFALVAQMTDPVATRREMRRIFQSLIGFLNIVGTMNGQPALELDVEKEGTAERVTSVYIPDAARDVDGQAKINFNFSPTAGFVGDRLVIASNRQLARRLTVPAAVPEKEIAPPVNSAARLDAGVLQSILTDNRDQLIAQNMLSEGRTREEAERQIDLVLSAVGWLRDAGLQLNHADNRLRLALSISISQPVSGTDPP